MTRSGRVMMFSSVVSLFLAGTAAFSAQEGVSVPPLNQALADAAISCTVTVRLSGVVLGQAVVVSDRGYAITTGEVAFGPDGMPRQGMEAVTSSRASVALSVVAFDPVTDLALVRLVGFQPSLTGVARVSSAEPQGVVLVVLPTGAVRAEVTRKSVTGVMAYSKRYVPLAEIRLERWSTAFGGAPVFQSDGSLVGMLMASLATEDTGRGAKQLGLNTEPERTEAYGLTPGPRPAATTYSLGAPVLGRVVSELTNTGIVLHPWIGVMFSTSEAGGALIESVVEEGPAEAAGIKKGDVVVEFNGQQIRSHIQLASILMNLPVGRTAEIKIARGKVVHTLKVFVIADPRAIKGELKRVPTPHQVRDRID